MERRAAAALCSVSGEVERQGARLESWGGGVEGRGGAGDERRQRRGLGGAACRQPDGGERWRARKGEGGGGVAPFIDGWRALEQRL
ncbi:unnamed protein product [Urochloa humidicola]